MSDQAYLTSKNKKIKNIDNDLQIKTSPDYYAKLHGFDFNGSEEMKDWTAAKAEIDNLLQTSKSGYELLKKSKEVSDHWNRVREQRNRTR
jgi:hypothetical protein